jgi:hypothetical protein
MSDESKAAVHWSFWLIAAFCLVWYLMGVWAYIDQTSGNFVASLPDAERLIIEQRPAWATGAFAIAVWVGAFGCVLLLLRKAFVFYIFIASLLGVIVQMYYNYAIANSIEVYGPGGHIMSVMILGIAIFLIWYAKYTASKGWVS